MNPQAIIETILRKHLIPAENFIYGFADLTGLLDPKFKGFNYGISIGKRLKDNIIGPVINGPTKEYYSHYKQMNNDLSILTISITDELRKNNIETIAVDPTVTVGALDTVYLKTLKTDLSHKMVATLAGLGWIGKTDLLISKKFGPRLRLVSILLKNQVISKTKPINKSRCGTCSICVDLCPARAANGKLWDITVEREEFFDPWKCRIQCAEFGKARIGIDTRICGVCVAVCPLGGKI
jgi:epoxyqueuosine reductase QueG